MKKTYEVSVSMVVTRKWFVYANNAGMAKIRAKAEIKRDVTEYANLQSITVTNCECLGELNS